MPLSSIACRAALDTLYGQVEIMERIRLGRPWSLRSTNQRSPWPPASFTFALTCSGSTACPPSKSAFTGTATASATSRRCSSTSSSLTWPSARPNVQANPELVVARALKPICSKARRSQRPTGSASQSNRRRASDETDLSDPRSRSLHTSRDGDLEATQLACRSDLPDDQTGPRPLWMATALLRHSRSNQTGGRDDASDVVVQIELSAAAPATWEFAQICPLTRAFALAA